MNWTPGLVALLKRNLSAGHSHSTVARMMGVSRGSVAGAARRLKKNRSKTLIEVFTDEGLDTKTIRTAESKSRKLADQLKLEQSLRQSAEEELERLVSEVEDSQEAASRSNPRYLKGETLRSGGHATAIICACDWHSEARIDRCQVNGVNEFNLEIATARIARLWRKSAYLLEFSRHISNIRDLVVWLGGDLIGGQIHPELAESNFIGPTDAILFVQDRVAEGLEFLLRECKVDHITVATNQGNHSRTSEKMRHGTASQHSWEYLAYCNLSRLFRNEPRISFKIERGYHNLLEVQGHLVRFHHGHAVRGGTGVGGLMIPLRKKIAQWDVCRKADLTICGHHHQFIDCWSSVVCGSLIGYDAFAIQNGFDFQQPTQTWIVVDRERGKIAALPIFVGDSQ